MGIDLVQGTRRPRLLILSDRPGSVYSDVGAKLAEQAASRYEVSLQFTSDPAFVADLSYDLVHVCCWWDPVWPKLGFDPARVLLHVLSLRDERSGAAWSVEDIFDARSARCSTFLTAGEDIFERFRFCRPVRRLDLGVDPGFFHPGGRTAGNPEALKFGHVSGARSKVAKFGAWIGGHILDDEADESERRMFYRAHDVVIATGDDLWSQRALVEAMDRARADGMIGGRHASDQVVSGVSGLIVADDDREIEAAMAWCRREPQAVIDGGSWASDEILVRANWNLIGIVYHGILWGRFCALNPDIQAA